MIIDASIAVKWLLPESSSIKAQALLNEGTVLFAPTILRDEVCGALAKANRQNRLAQPFIRKAYTLLVSIISQHGVHLIPHKEIEKTSIETALTHNHHYQDCVYIALALKENMPLATADKHQAKLASSNGIECILF